MKNVLHFKNDLQIDNKIEKIWTEYYSDNLEPLSALYQESALKNAITFLSLNPSLQPKDRDKAQRGFYPDKPYPMIDCRKEKAIISFFKNSMI